MEDTSDTKVPSFCYFRFVNGRAWLRLAAFCDRKLCRISKKWQQIHTHTRIYMNCKALCWRVLVQDDNAFPLVNVAFQLHRETTRDTSFLRNVRNSWLCFKLSCLFLFKYLVSQLNCLCVTKASVCTCFISPVSLTVPLALNCTCSNPSCLMLARLTTCISQLPQIRLLNTETWFQPPIGHSEIRGGQIDTGFLCQYCSNSARSDFI